MYSTLFTTSLVFVLLALHARADFKVATVELTQCQPATLSWAQTDGPYNVIIVPSDKPCGDPLVDLGDHESNTFNWSKVNITAGTKVMVSILDDKEQEGWSGVITVKSSNDKSCLISQDGTPGHSSPSPTPSHTTGSPTPTVVGAANAGLAPNGASMIHLSGVAVVFTALGALAALL